MPSPSQARVAPVGPGLAAPSMQQQRRARHSSRAALVMTVTGMLGLMGALVVLVSHKAPSNVGGAPTRFLSSRVVTESSTHPPRMLSLGKDRRAAAAALTANLRTKDKQAAATTAAAASTANYSQEALADEIKDLPGLDEALTFRHFSGYLPITKSKNIFYWYVEAAENADEAPLVFWTNGGPGCSGLFGFMNENGPFRPSQDGKSVHLNPYSWNLAANMLFVEQPVTVGFSYTTNEMDKQFGDAQAAEDNYLVVQKFLERFPHLRAKELHLSGESYGGHYLPQLAQYIVDANEKKKDAAEHVNLKGFLVGNPLTDPVENLIGAIDAFWGHSLVPHDLYDAWAVHCRNQTDNLEVLFSNQCQNLQNEMWANVQGLNPYALDFPVCHEPGAAQHVHRDGMFPPASPDFLAQGRNQRYKLLSHSLPAVVRGGLEKVGDVFKYEPCEDAYASAYLNREDVQKAIHAKKGTNWGDCSDTVFYNFNRQDRQASMQPVYTYLTEEKKDLALRILIFSGDDDSVCATQGTQYWIHREQWPRAPGQDWGPWGVNGQVAGFIQGFQNGITFATVHNAGHEGTWLRGSIPTPKNRSSHSRTHPHISHTVPAYKPVEALALFEAYINDEIWREEKK